MAGAVFVEYVFDWKGIGVLIVDSLEKTNRLLIVDEDVSSGATAFILDKMMLNLF